MCLSAGLFLLARVQIVIWREFEDSLRKALGGVAKLFFLVGDFSMIFEVKFSEEQERLLCS